MESGAPHPRSPRVRSVGATITSVSRNLVSAGALICTEVGADDQICGSPAEWVALEGPSTQWWLRLDASPMPWLRAEPGAGYGL